MSQVDQACTRVSQLLAATAQVTDLSFRQTLRAALFELDVATEGQQDNGTLDSIRQRVEAVLGKAPLPKHGEMTLKLFRVGLLMIATVEDADVKKRN